MKEAPSGNCCMALFTTKKERNKEKGHSGCSEGYYVITGRRGNLKAVKVSDSLHFHFTR